jgi:hypothetical protein
MISDVRDVPTLPDLDLLTGSPPCQPFSVANLGDRRRFEADDRHLWPEMYRLIRTGRPRAFIFENVAASYRLGGEFSEHLATLARDYELLSLVVPATALGAPHLRRRLFVLGRMTPGAGSSLCVESPWLRDYPGPYSTDTSPQMRDRIRALGNAVVVPVAEAMIHLLHSEFPLHDAWRLFHWSPRYRPRLDEDGLLRRVQTTRAPFPTPIHSDYRGSTGDGIRRGTLVETIATLPERWGHTHTNRTIYPDPGFYEYLMGFPQEWTHDPQLP